MRTIGARDKYPRKERRDRIHKRKRNRAGNLVPYVPKRGKSDPIKAWFFELRTMSIDGYRNWSRGAREHVKRVVFYPVGKPFLVEPERLSTPENIEQLAIDVVGFDGTFQLRMPCHAKNTYRVSFKKRATVKIFDSEEGLKAKASDINSLSRYWFWRAR